MNLMPGLVRQQDFTKDQFIIGHPLIALNYPSFLNFELLIRNEKEYSHSPGAGLDCRSYYTDYRIDKSASGSSVC